MSTPKTLWSRVTSSRHRPKVNSAWLSVTLKLPYKSEQHKEAQIVICNLSEVVYLH